jgi:hypothetical protein
MTNPSDGRLSSQATFTGSLSGADLLFLVSPPTPASAINYKLPIATFTAAIGTLPPGGSLGQILENLGTTNFSAQWTNLSNLVLGSTGIFVAGSTTLGVQLASTVGLSVLGVGGAATAVPAAIGPGTADQAFIVDHTGSTAFFGALNLATSAAVTGVLGVVNGGLGTSVLSVFDGAGWGLTTTNLTTVAVATVNPPFGLTPAINFQINATVAGNSLTLNIVGNNGLTPSPTNPILFPFNNNSGGARFRIATTALSLTINQTATLGATSGFPFRGWIVAFDPGTNLAPIIGIINCLQQATFSPPQVFPLTPTLPQSPTAITQTAITSGIFYASTSANLLSMEILGFIEYVNMTTAGQWSNVPDVISLYCPGLRKPGDTVQISQANTTTGSGTIVTTVFTTALSAVITPISRANLISVETFGSLHVGAAVNSGSLGITRGTAAGPCLMDVNLTSPSAALAFNVPASLAVLDWPRTAVSQQYSVVLRSDGTGNCTFGSGGLFGNSFAFLKLTEIMA